MNCIALTSLPDELGSLSSRWELAIESCTALASLPAGWGRQPAQRFRGSGFRFNRKATEALQIKTCKGVASKNIIKSSYPADKANEVKQ